MLIVFPLGLLGASLVFDVIHLAIGRPEMATVSSDMIIGGLIGGLIALQFGTIDWLAIPAANLSAGWASA